MSEWRTGPTTAVHWHIRARGHLRGEDAVAPAVDNLGLPWSHLAAASCGSAMLAGMRPRSLTGMLWPFAHARVSPLRSRGDEVRPGRQAAGASRSHTALTAGS